MFDQIAMVPLQICQDDFADLFPHILPILSLIFPLFALLPTVRSVLLALAAVVLVHDTYVLLVER